MPAFPSVGGADECGQRQCRVRFLLHEQSFIDVRASVSAVECPFPTGEGRRRRSLNYTVNFSADVTNSNDFLFAFYGLAGRYRGRFATVPYYIKIREYTDMESRDLWEYDLSLIRRRCSVSSSIFGKWARRRSPIILSPRIVRINYFRFWRWPTPH